MTHHAPTIRSWPRVLLVLGVLATPLTLSAVEEAESKQQVREKAFIEAMSGTTLTGFFSVVGEDKAAPPNEDSYQISRISKGGNFFLFHAKFGEAKLPPLPLRVVWAGTKPVITMEKIAIPGFGTFATKTRQARTGTNPSTGDKIQISSKTYATFKPGKNLREKIG